jgi:hypothetical protein
MIYSCFSKKGARFRAAGYDTAYGYGFVRLDLCLNIKGELVLLSSSIEPSGARLSFNKPPDAGTITLPQLFLFKA